MPALLAGIVLFAGVAVVVGVMLLREDSNASDAAGRELPEPLADVGDVAVLIEDPEGEERDFCLLVAETADERQQGLMGVTDPDLGGYDGMLFRFDSEVEVGFWMMNTPMPLSVAYIGEDGSLVSTADMEPCADQESIAAGCASYPPDGPYRWALEVPQGGLSELGLAPGSRFTDTDRPCAD
jgi:uncharacterized membrane protein (UPF0127 family)